MARGHTREVSAAELVALRETVLRMQNVLREECAIDGTDRARERVGQTLSGVLRDFDEMIGRRALFPGPDEAEEAAS